MKVGQGNPDASSVDAILASLAAGRSECLRHVRVLPERQPTTEPWPEWCADAVREAWASRGVHEPWRHQVLAANALHSGRHVVLATGTASGKSLAFTMPAMSRILSGVDALKQPTVLYIAPTKALSYDQLRAVDELGVAGIRAAVCDGDTGQDERAWARQHANYLITNPDMLHHSILPGHTTWSRFLRRVEIVVVDEAHSYRGVFGAHISAVLRRLRRVCAHYGSDPTFFFASATIAEPERSALRLIHAPVVSVEEDFSPRPPITVALWEPGLDQDGEARSALRETADLLTDLVIDDRQCLGFVRSRRGAEAVASMVRDHLAEVDDSLASRVAAYRGGYLPEERRLLESQLREGTIRALATTSALEMGIDVSGLDAVVTAGWPGTRASLWQQFGRAGRSDAPALAIFVARDDPLDSFLVAHPEMVLDKPVEATIFDPENSYVMAPHLCAAAQELPLTQECLDTWFGPKANDVVDNLVADGLLRKRPTGWFWTDRTRASDLADLRGSGGAPVRVVENGTGRLLGTIDAASAPSMVHPGAVYVHQGVTHIVDELDLDDSVAIVRQAPVDYFTISRSISDIRIIDIADSCDFVDVQLARGQVEVTSQVVSFQRRTYKGHSLGDEALDLPEQRLMTQAVWWTYTPASLAAGGVLPEDVPGSVHAAEHAAIGLLPLFATCDRWDLGGVSTASHIDTGLATIFVYDGFPGGAGFAAHGFDVVTTWLGATHDAIASCPCADGCPSCVQSPKCGNGNNPLHKAGAIALLEQFLASARADRTGTRPGHDITDRNP